MKPVSSMLAIVLLASVASAAAAETPASDPAAVEIADRVMAALGGKARWDALPCIRWSFGSESNDTVRWSRRHAWNKHTGWHRVDGTNRGGQRYCVVHKVGETDGKAWVDGTALEGDSLAKMVKLGQSTWINDAYWFLMPYKLRDPGVTLKVEGEVKDGDRVYDRVGLSFDQVGETPGDRYWVYVNRATARIERWEMLLQGDAPPHRMYTLEDWQEHGGLWFATAHRRDQGNIFTRDIATSDALPPDTFERP